MTPPRKPGKILLPGVECQSPNQERREFQREIQKTLNDLLREHRHDPKYSGPPFASLAELRNGRSLVAGYVLVRGGDAVNDSAVSIRGYRAQDGHFRLVDSTDVDQRFRQVSNPRTATL